ncbi:D-lactaldehyde dehydrogenase [Cantharellus anzutake]|uniref:D-lactaldehyde dehydrogenase n=1 Tax=Cantharellus anzutake TaxID=1750568 RepID=UPI001906B8E0|nr:D-lactaldehyde dehydrogenase [Cantharellus anzutake]KAF8343833.1 D-lactaldehyde dehydrogenase [Cantharellus anzutake]
MVGVKAPATVLVTGASGFIAVWVVKSLLERGFSVLGTVRSAPKGEYVKNLFEKDFSGKFSYVVVEDVAQEGAFDETVKNVDAVAHTASPFHMKGTHPDDYFVPAIKGTTGILESILKYGTNVKRVVVTSSNAACYNLEGDGLERIRPQVVAEQGRDAPPASMYRASKTFAERAAWDFVEKRKGEIKFDLVTILPPWVYGPILHDCPNPEQLNTSAAYFRRIALDPSATHDRETLLKPTNNWVDVRNVADAHAEAVVRDNAGGERYLISNGAYIWQEFLDALAQTELKDKVNKGLPGELSTTPNPKYSSGAKAAKELGIVYIDKKTSALDTAQSLLERFP